MSAIEAARDRLDTASGRLALRLNQLPGWVLALLIYGLSRVIVAVIIDRTGRFQPKSVWTPHEHPGYLGMLSLWDGEWYHEIQKNGYPLDVPRDGSGLAFQNAWAFYPAFPYLAKGLMAITGWSWPVAASSIALVCGGLAMVVLRALLAPRIGPGPALMAVALVCTFPSAPVLQLAYSESLALLLLCGFLLLLDRRHYFWAIPVILAMGVARPLAAPLALVVAAHGIHRLWNREREPLTPGQWAGGIALGLASGVAGMLWPTIAGRVTGEPNAYLDTMAAWRSSHQVSPLRPWYDVSGYFFGDLTGPVLVGVCVAALVVWIVFSAVPIGLDLRMWCLAYLLYLLVVLDPITSLFRYLLMFFPLAALAAGASSDRAYRRTILAAFVAGQVVWVVWLWRFLPPSDWPP